MKNYINKNNEIYSYEDDVPKEFLDAKIVELGLTPISDEDLAELRKPTLEQLKTSKTSEINTACGNEIVSGFKSDALGTAHNYQSAEIDQLNLIGAVAGGTEDYFKAGTKDADDVITYEYKMHTAVQLLQVLNDGKAHKQTLLQKANGLKVQVAEATTVEEVEAIVW